MNHIFSFTKYGTNAAYYALLNKLVSCGKSTFSKYAKALGLGGSENKGAFATWVNHFNAPPIITKITARTLDFPLSNSMAESTHSIYKTEFLKGQVSRTVKNHLDSLEKFVTYYNYERSPGDLCG